MATLKVAETRGTCCLVSHFDLRRVLRARHAAALRGFTVTTAGQVRPFKALLLPLAEVSGQTREPKPSYLFVHMTLFNNMLRE